MAKKGILGLFGQKKSSGSVKDRTRRSGSISSGEHLSLLAGKEHISSPLTWSPHPNPQSKPPVPDRTSLGPLPSPSSRHKRIVSTVEETLLSPQDSWDDSQSEVVPLASVAEDVVISFDPKRNSNSPSLSPSTLPMTPTTPASSKMGSFSIADDDYQQPMAVALPEPPRMPTTTTTSASSSPKLPTVSESPLDEEEEGAVFAMSTSPVIPRRHSARGQMPFKRLSFRSTESATAVDASAKPSSVPRLSQRYAGDVAPPSSSLPQAKPVSSSPTPDPISTSASSPELLPPHDLHPSAENLDGISEYDITSRHVETYKSAAKPQMVEVPKSPMLTQSDLAGVSNIDVVDVGAGFGSDSEDGGVLKPQTVEVPADLSRDLPSASSMASDLYREAYMQLMDKYNSTVERHRKEVASLQTSLEQEREKSKHLMRVMTSRKPDSTPSPRDKFRTKFIVPLEIVRSPESGTSDESLDPQGVHECSTSTPLETSHSEESEAFDKRTTAYFTARSGSPKTELAELDANTEVNDPQPQVNRTDPKAPALASSIELVHLQSVLHQPYEEEDDDVSSVDDIFDFDITAAVAFEESDSNMTTPEACATDKF